MEKIQRIYLSGPVSKGVSDSQMINWAGLLAEHGIETRFFIFYHRKLESKFLKMKSVDKNDMISGISYPNLFLIREIVFFFSIVRILKTYSKSDRIIIQTRTPIFAFPIILVAFFRKVRIVYEIRGTGEEGIMTGKDSVKVLKKLNDFIMLRISDWIFSVSGRLIRYKSDKYNLPDITGRTIIIHGAADSSLFYYDENLRKKKREQLGIIKRTALLYIGMLDKTWQVPGLIFDLAANLKKQVTSLFLMIITPDIQIADSFRKKYGLSDNDILVKESVQKDLKEYINAADFGLLIRENKLVNNVAAPTKYAEYLLCGLPVIISEGVGDYSEFTSVFKTGIVINNKDINYRKLASEISAPDIFNRDEIQNIAKQHLSKQVLTNILVDAFKSR